MLDLKLLGGAALEDATGAIDGPATRRYPLAILALLATAPSDRLGRGKLTGLLWPDSPERTARTRLNTYVYAIRSELGEEILVSVGDDLQLNEKVVGADVWRFEAALEAGEYENAVQLYGGPFLDGFELVGSDTFEHHVERERARLRLAYMKALEARASAAAEREGPEAAVPWWRKRASEDPYDSRAAHRFMLALSTAGNPAAALRVAREHARLLREEFGTEPSAEVAAMVEKLKASRPRTPSHGQAASALEPVEVGTEEDSPSRSGPSRRTPPRMGAIALVAFGLLGAGTTGGWYLLGAGSSEASGTPKRTIAVLPLESLGDEGTDAFAEGLHSELSTRLARVRSLEIVSRGSVLRFRDPERALPEIGRELGANWLVRGEVRRAGDDVRVNVRLLEADRDRQVWAESYRKAWTAENLFAIQGEITQAIVRALRIALDPEERRRLAAVPTENTAAYELYLQAQHLDRLLREEPGSGIPDRKVELYRRALELDPDFPPALAGLADAYLEIAWNADDPSRWVDSAAAVTRKALELDPELAVAHAQLGDVHLTLGQTEEAIVAYRKALALDQSNFDAMNNLTSLLWSRGRLADAMRWLDRWHRVSPASDVPIAYLFRLNATLGREDAAETWLARGRRAGHPLALDAFLGELARGDLDAARGIWRERSAVEAERTVTRGRAALALYAADWREARRQYRALYPGVAWGPEPLFRGLLSDPLGLAYALDRLGDRESSREIAAEVVRTIESERIKHPEWSGHHRLAVSHLLLGDTTTALDQLEAAVDAGYRSVAEMSTAPTVALLRNHPRFRALVERMEIMVAEERRRVDMEGWGLPD